MKNRDPLLMAGLVMTYLLMGLTLLVAIFLIAMIPGLFLFSADFGEAVTASGGDSVGAALAASITLLALGATMTIGGFFFFKILSNLIGTVASGSPFTIENSKRLSLMGWISLVFQIATIPVSVLVVFLKDLVPVENLTVDFDFSLTGILLAIVLFILARVFKLGAEMRDDLEGTV